MDGGGGVCVCVCVYAAFGSKNVGVCQIQLNECYDEMHPTLTRLTGNCFTTRKNVTATTIAAAAAIKRAHNSRMQAEGRYK